MCKNIFRRVCLENAESQFQKRVHIARVLIKSDTSSFKQFNPNNMASRELIMTFFGTGAMKPAFRRGSNGYPSNY